ncbi:uncharacterized protein LOC106874633 [Octopus bimaculoides]|uniref:Cation-dependent mannose-6-phosphate receptor n=1 Tax=Octopus bimaculoides TaxID=37653 RepID=A0A0L8GVL2_OCTBM|nr:uncharacterized protein LOC106874633 [Octopus bimaculoides]|eukprot:XP_014777913.1 PREDICTED: uncharacterized protein LOC106874633 [Octopus bimaculoides]
MVDCYFPVTVRLIILLTLGLLAKSENCRQTTYCSCQRDNGDVVDLQQFGDRVFQNMTKSAIYKWLPCAQMDCNNVTQTICQFNVISPSVQFPNNLGSIKSVHFTVSKGNVILTYTDPSGNTKSTVALVCSEGKEATFLFIGRVRGFVYQTYNFQLQSKHFCPSHSLSTGTIICIVLLCVLVLYLVLGVVFNIFVQHKSGCNAVPNADSWKSSGDYIQDGFAFTLTKCGKLNKRKEYNEI